MASYKTASKGELVAIYRLEFYKNKKKWKFCKNERQLKKDAPTKQKLNETYRVDDEPPPDVEPPEPLNDAFLETDSDENIKENPKPEPPPPTLRRWKNTILDMKPPPEERDWAIPDVKAEHGWEPSIEPVRNYEDEWGEDGGWDGGERWGDDMQCVEQVFASELCVSGAQRPRLPVFAAWPAPADPLMLQHLVQGLAAQQGHRPSVADALRQQVDSAGHNVGHFGQNVGLFGQNVGQIGQNVGLMGQNVGQVGQNAGQIGQNVGHVRQNIGQMGQNVGHMGQNAGQMEQNVGQMSQNVGNFGQNTRHMGQNVEHAGQIGQNVGRQILRQNTEILDHVDHSLKCNTQNIAFMEEPEILKQNLYQNCKIGHIIEQNLRHDEKMVDFGQMEWEPERDLCELGLEVGGEVCAGDACVAGAVAALAEAEGWLTGSLKHFYLEPALGEALSAPLSPCDVSLSSGDSAAFERGAHARPHSSEVDLTSYSPCECASTPASKLAHMSSAALRDTLRGHARAVQRVLHELRARAQHTNRQPCALSRDVTHESLPTRDTQPPPTAARDTAPHATPHDMLPGRGRGRRLLTK